MRGTKLGQTGRPSSLPPWSTPWQPPHHSPDSVSCGSTWPAIHYVAQADHNLPSTGIIGLPWCLAHVLLPSKAAAWKLKNRVSACYPAKSGTGLSKLYPDVFTQFQMYSHKCSSHRGTKVTLQIHSRASSQEYKVTCHAMAVLWKSQRINRYAAIKK